MKILRPEHSFQIVYFSFIFLFFFLLSGHHHWTAVEIGYLGGEGLIL